MGAVGGLGAIVLGIIGLAGVYPEELAGIAAILIGASLLLEGGAMISSLRQIGMPIQQGSEGIVTMGSTTAEFFFAGVAGVVLGILTLLNVFPATLLAVAAIVYGAALLFSSGTISSFGHAYWGMGTIEQNRTWALARSAAATVASGQAFLGLGTLVLGILALIGLSTMVLELVAFVCVGAAIFFCGSAVGARSLEAA